MAYPRLSCLAWGQESNWDYDIDLVRLAVVEFVSFILFNLCMCTVHEMQRAMMKTMMLIEIVKQVL